MVMKPGCLSLAGKQIIGYIDVEDQERFYRKLDEDVMFKEAFGKVSPEHLNKIREVTDYPVHTKILHLPNIKGLIHGPREYLQALLVGLGDEGLST